MTGSSEMVAQKCKGTRVVTSTIKSCKQKSFLAPFSDSISFVNNKISY